MKRVTARCFLILMTFMLGISLKDRAQVIEIGLNGSASFYMGDINPNKIFDETQISWGVLARYYESSRWAFRLSYNNINIEGSDEKVKYREERGLDFKTNIHDFSLVAEFNFFNYKTGSKKNFISPYILGGVGFIMFTPKAMDGTKLSGLHTEGESYSTSAVTIPFGVGMKCSVSKKICLALEWRMNKTFTDYLDDVHGLYPEEHAIVNGHDYTDPTGHYPAGVQRGNKDTTDWFSYLGVSLTYKIELPTKQSCNNEYIRE